MKTFIMVAALAFSFMSGHQVANKSNPKLSTDYYWFNNSATYLWRQSSYATESSYTGFDNNPAAPSTLQERGFAPANCNGDNPPVPLDFDSPDILLFSHP